MNKTAVITGGTKGIGKSLVMHFAKLGFDIITNSRRFEDLVALQSEVKSETGTDIYIYKADFEKKEEVVAFGEFVQKTFSTLNVLINNAGIFIPGQTMTETEGVYEKEIAINLTAPYYLTRILLPQIESSMDGYIFNICSTASFTPYINGGSYCISKFGLLGFTKVLRQELKDRRIGVSAVMPGATLTESWAGTDLSEEYFMHADNVSAFIVSAWANRKHAIMEEIVIRPYPGDL